MMKISLSVPIICILLIGCDQPNDAATSITPGSTHVIRPLKTGNNWNYRNITINMATKETTYANLTQTIAGQNSYNREEWFYDNNGTFFVNRSTGLWEGGSSSAAALTALYPAKRNDTFNASYTSQLIVTVIAVDSTITVPAGTFSCYVYSKSDSVSDIVRWYAVGVGEVYNEVRMKSQFTKDYMFRSVLTSYSFK